MRRFRRQQADQRQGKIEHCGHDETLAQSRRLRQVAGRSGGDNLRRTVYMLAVALTETSPFFPAATIGLPAAPALVAGFADAAWLTPDGEVEILKLGEAAKRAKATPPFLCHTRATAR